MDEEDNEVVHGVDQFHTIHNSILNIDTDGDDEGDDDHHYDIDNSPKIEAVEKGLLSSSPLSGTPRNGVNYGSTTHGNALRKVTPLSNSNNTHAECCDVPTPKAPEDEENDSFTKWLVEKFGNQSVLIFYSTMLLFTAVGNSIFFKRMTNNMTNYPFYLAQISTIVYVPVFWYIAHRNGSVTDEMRKFPKRKFFYMGGLDAISGIFMLFGGVYTPGSLQALLSNAVIPMTMFTAYVWLREKFTRSQILGALVIMSGICVAMVPALLSEEEKHSKSKPVFVLLFFLNNIPSALSAVYKDYAFQNVDIDVNYMQAWIAISQVIFGFLLIPFNTLPILGTSAIPWSGLGKAFLNGFGCTVGINMVEPPHCVYPGERDRALINSLPPCDNCSGAWIVVVIYLLFNMSFNYLMIVLIKISGASFMYVISTLRLPLVQLAFSIKFINNPPEKFGLPAVGGLLLILGGMTAYKYGEEKLTFNTTVSAALASGVAGSVGSRPNAAVHERKRQRWLQIRSRICNKDARTHRFGLLSKLYGLSPRSPLLQPGSAGPGVIEQLRLTPSAANRDNSPRLGQSSRALQGHRPDSPLLVYRSGGDSTQPGGV